MTERAVLAGGCFWGMQDDLIRKLPGVIETRFGKANVDRPTVGTPRHREHFIRRDGGVWSTRIT